MSREEGVLHRLEKDDVQKITGEEMEESEDDGVHVGDVTNHYHEKPKKDEKTSGLLKAAAGAALLATGVGGGAGLAMFLQGGKDVIDDVSPQIRYMLDVGGGKEVQSE